MIGKLISGVIKIVAAPIIATEIVMDVVCGGDGSYESRTDGIAPASEITKAICEQLENKKL